MKLVKILTNTGLAIGVEKDMGRVERIVEPSDPTVPMEIIERLVLCWNACEGISGQSLAHMASGNSRAGTMVERAVAWSEFWIGNKATAERFLKKAREEIEAHRAKGKSL